MNQPSGGFSCARAGQTLLLGSPNLRASQPDPVRTSSIVRVKLKRFYIKEMERTLKAKRKPEVVQRPQRFMTPWYPLALVHPDTKTLARGCLDPSFRLRPIVPAQNVLL